MKGKGGLDTKHDCPEYGDSTVDWKWGIDVNNKLPWTQHFLTSLVYLSSGQREDVQDRVSVLGMGLGGLA